MEIKFRPIEKIINDLIIKCSDYCYNGWTLHAIGDSQNQYVFRLVDKDGKEKDIRIDCYEEDNNEKT